MRAVVVVGVLALGVLVGLCLRGDVASPEKQAAMGALSSGTEVPVVDHTIPQMRVSGDEGDSAAVSEIKQELVALEERLSASYVMPGPAERGALIARKSPQQSQMRAEIESEALGAVADVFVWHKVAQHEQETAQAIALAFDDPQYRGFSESRFVVDKWHGVQVAGDEALALLEAHQEYLLNAEDADGSGEWLTDPVRRWQVKLERDDGAWRIAEQAQDSLTGQG